MLATKLYFISIIIFAYSISSCYSENFNWLYKTVRTENGAVRGRLTKSLFKKTPYYAFKGIPFAQPPIGELRFKPPEPVKDWYPRIIDAFEYGAACYIYDTKFETPNMSEDCLYMNVFLPANPKKKLAVMLNIVGGGFTTNSADEHVSAPDFLVERDIIVVTFNYRLNAFGFMSLNTPEYSGNMGMKDQQMAMEWVYKNIEYFGGDKTKITLSGHSTGAISVNYHALNAESRKYFHQMICTSGTALHFNAYHDGNHKCLMYEIARNASQPANNLKELIAYLKTAPADQIHNYIGENVELPYGNPYTLPWAPVIERADAVRPFLTMEPIRIYNKLEQMNISSFITFANRETNLFETPTDLMPDSVNAHIENLDFHLSTHEFNMSYTKEPYLRGVLEEIRDFYFENATSNFDRADHYVKMNTDILFLQTIDKFVKLQVQKSSKPTYYLRFSMQGNIDVFKHDFGVKSVVPGAAHSDNLCYIFRCTAYDYFYTDILRYKNINRDCAVSYSGIRYMSKLYANFVKYGKPSHNGNPIRGYKPVQLDEVNFLDVTNGGLILGKSPNDRNAAFLDRVLAKARKLIAKNNRIPQMTEFEYACDKIKQRQANI